MGLLDENLNLFAILSIKLVLIENKLVENK
jgi:hypothetical protein